MNVYLARLPVDDYLYSNYGYGKDYAIVIVAEDELHAERKARRSSYDFKQAKKISISQVNLDEEAVVLIANVGGQHYERNYF